MQSQLAELRAAQEARDEAHRQELEAQRAQLQFFAGLFQQILVLSCLRCLPTCSLHNLLLALQGLR